MAAEERIGEQFPAVLEAARSGADWAWERIYDSLAPTMLGYLRSRGAPDPDGVCGEVFAQLVRDLGRFEGDEAGFRSWVFVMVHHRLLDDIRWRRRRPEDPSSDKDFSGMTGGVDVEAQAVGRITEDELRALVDELTDAQRDVLLLRIFGGLRIEEVAVAMKRRVGAVKALQRRGLASLRTKLTAKGYPDEDWGR